MWSKLNMRRNEINVLNNQIINQGLDLNTRFVLMKASIPLLVGNFEGYIRECYERLYYVIKEKEIDLTTNELFLVKCISYYKTDEKENKKEKEIIKRIKSYSKFIKKDLELEKYFNKTQFLKEYRDIEDIYILFEFFIFKYFDEEFYRKSEVILKIIEIIKRYNINASATNLYSYGGKEIYIENLFAYILSTLTQIKELNITRNFIAHGDSSDKALFNLKIEISSSNFNNCLQKYEIFKDRALFLMELIEFYINQL